MTSYDTELLRYALVGLEAEKKALEEKIAELQERLGTGTTSKAAKSESASPRGGRALSAAARRRIAEAQRKRWAAFRKQSGPSAKQAGAEKPAAAKKRVLSPEARARIAAAQRKRWAAARKGR